MSIEHLDLAVVSQNEVLAAIESIHGREIDVLRLLSSDDAINAYEINRSRKAILTLPWMPAEYGRPFGVTEITGPDGAPDVPAHIDVRSPSVLNVHTTTRGSVAAFFARDIPSNYFDEYNDMKLDMSVLAMEGYAVDDITVSAGDVLCFCGGAVVHQFTSLTQNRRSFVRSFTKG